MGPADLVQKGQFMTSSDYSNVQWTIFGIFDHMYWDFELIQLTFDKEN